MQYIKKLKLTNFKRFKEFEVEFSSEINTIIAPDILAPVDEKDSFTFITSEDDKE